jgi:phosphoglycolate phosphatase
MIRHILFFDIDGTLLLTGGAGQRAMELALTEEFGVSCPFDGILTAGRTDRGIADEIFARYDLEDNPSERERFRAGYLNKLQGMLQPSPGAVLVGVRELLHTLHQRPDVHLTLLTGNYSDGAWLKLRAFGLDRYFQGGGFGDHHAHRDDVARAAVDHVRSTLGNSVNDGQLCVIGDTPADIQCARAIGARAVGVATGQYSVDDLQPCAADHVLPNLSDTGRVVSALLGLPL